MFLEYIDNWIKENEKLINERQLKIEHVINHDGKKIEVGISNVINKNGGSVALIDDGTKNGTTLRNVGGLFSNATISERPLFKT